MSTTEPTTEFEEPWPNYSTPQSKALMANESWSRTGFAFYHKANRREMAEALERVEGCQGGGIGRAGEAAPPDRGGLSERPDGRHLPRRGCRHAGGRSGPALGRSHRMTSRISHTVLQARHHEIGRIRMGVQEATK